MFTQAKHVSVHVRTFSIQLNTAVVHVLVTSLKINDAGVQVRLTSIHDAAVQMCVTSIQVDGVLFRCFGTQRAYLFLREIVELGLKRELDSSV